MGFFLRVVGGIKQRMVFIKDMNLSFKKNYIISKYPQSYIVGHAKIHA